MSTSDYLSRGHFPRAITKRRFTAAVLFGITNRHSRSIDELWKLYPPQLGCTYSALREFITVAVTSSQSRIANILPVLKELVDVLAKEEVLHIRIFNLHTTLSDTNQLQTYPSTCLTKQPGSTARESSSVSQRLSSRTLVLTKSLLRITRLL